jgi:hypothetical protein
MNHWTRERGIKEVKEVKKICEILFKNFYSYKPNNFSSYEYESISFINNLTGKQNDIINGEYFKTLNPLKKSVIEIGGSISMQYETHYYDFTIIFDDDKTGEKEEIYIVLTTNDLFNRYKYIIREDSINNLLNEGDR